MASTPKSCKMILQFLAKVAALEGHLKSPKCFHTTMQFLYA